MGVEGRGCIPVGPVLACRTQKRPLSWENVSLYADAGDGTPPLYVWGLLSPMDTYYSHEFSILPTRRYRNTFWLVRGGVWVLHRFEGDAGMQARMVSLVNLGV